MASVSKKTSIKQIQNFIQEVFGIPNDRHFELNEMLNNIQRFAMRGLKGIRKENTDEIKKNLMISFSWFVSTLNRLHIDLEEEVWKRFPYLCSYCGSCPCVCKTMKVQKRVKMIRDNSKRPKTLSEFQEMFGNIYPASTRNLDNAGVHLAEEVGEFSEALTAYRGERKETDFYNVLVEAADYFSCLIGVFNSLNLSLSAELTKIFSNNCHVCHQAPCICEYTYIKSYRTKD